MKQHVRIKVLSRSPAPKTPSSALATTPPKSTWWETQIEKAKQAELEAQRNQEVLESAKQYAQLNKEAQRFAGKQIAMGKISWYDFLAQHDIINQYIITHTQDPIIQYATFNTEVANAFLEATKPPPRPKHKPNFWQKAFTIAKIAAVGAVAWFVPAMLPTAYGMISTALTMGVACAATDAVCQELAIGLELQDKIAWNEVLETGIGAGIGSAAAGGGMFAHVAANSLGGAVTQGVEIALDMREKFDLNAVAFQAGAAVVAASLNELMPTVDQVLKNTIPQVVDTLGEANVAMATSSIINTTAQSTLSSVMMHSSMSLESLAMNAIGSVLGNKFGAMARDSIRPSPELLSNQLTDVHDQNIDSTNMETAFDFNNMCFTNDVDFSQIELPTQAQVAEVFDMMNQAADRLEILTSLEQIDPLTTLDTPDLLGTLENHSPQTAQAINNINTIPNANSEISMLDKAFDLINDASSQLESLTPFQKISLVTGLTIGALLTLPESVAAGMLTLLSRVGAAFMIGPTSEAVILDTLTAESMKFLPATAIGTAVVSKFTQFLSRFGFFKSTPVAEVEKSESLHNLARNRVQHEALKAELRQTMEKPLVQDTKLQEFINELYRPNASIGSGSTADAIRQELSTGSQVGGRMHIQKGEDTLRNLNRWIKNNPTASPGDRAVVENIVQDLNDALGYKQRPNPMKHNF